MGTLLAVLALAAAPPPAIAIPGLNGVRLTPGEADLYGEVLSVELSQLGLKVFTGRDVGQMLGMERQQQLLGCGETSSCVIEMIGAMGVDAVLIGDIGQLGEQFVLNFKVLSAKDGSSIALYNARAANVAAMPDELTRAAADITRQIAVALKRPELTPKEQVAAAAAPDRRKMWAISPAVVGVAAMAVGVVLEVQAHSALSALRSAGTAQDAVAAAGRGRTFEPVGWALIGVGGAALLAAGALWLLGRPSSGVAAIATPDGAALAFWGALP